MLLTTSRKVYNLLMTNNDEKNKSLGITHVNIRQSISIVIVKMFFVELIFDIFAIFSHFIFINLLNPEIAQIFIDYQPHLLVLLLIFKALFTFYVLLAWLNEYYEISTERIAHIRGVFFTKEKRYDLGNIRQIIIRQSLIGRLLNYGTIEFYDYAVKKYYQLYLIHNPMKYFNLLRKIVPDHDEIEETTRTHIIETDNTL